VTDDWQRIDNRSADPKHAPIIAGAIMLRINHHHAIAAIKPRLGEVHCQVAK
jgi:hypothetical protein